MNRLTNIFVSLCCSIFELRSNSPRPDINRHPLPPSHHLHRHIEQAFSNSNFSKRVRIEYLFTVLFFLPMTCRSHALMSLTNLAKVSEGVSSFAID